MKILLLTFFLSFAAWGGYGTATAQHLAESRAMPCDTVKAMRTNAVKSALTLSRNSSATELTLVLQNCAPGPFVTYAYGESGYSDMFSGKEFACGPIGHGVGLLVYDEQREQVFRRSDSDTFHGNHGLLIDSLVEGNPRPVEHEIERLEGKLEEIEAQATQSLAESRRVLAPGEKLTHKVNLDLTDYPLEKGTYQLLFVYSLHETIYDRLGAEHRARDEGMLFSGCVDSGKIEVVVD